ncbi:MAG: hypothetical protein AAGD38_17700 [Acidobacteriota bacterium]
MPLNQTLTVVVRDVPGCLAAGVVDMTTGMLLAIRTVDSHPQEVIDLLAAATGDIFQGPNVTMIERLFKQARGLPEDDSERYIQEIIILSNNLIHIFVRSKHEPNQVLVTVTRTSTNLGMALARTRHSLKLVEDTL